MAKTLLGVLIIDFVSCSNILVFLIEKTRHVAAACVAYVISCLSAAEKRMLFTIVGNVTRGARQAMF